MPIHIKPEDVRGLGPEARAQIEEARAAARETAAASEAVPPFPGTRPAGTPPPTAAHGSGERTVRLVLIGSGGAIALLIAGMLLGGVLRPVGTVPAPNTGTSAVSATATGSSGGASVGAGGGASGSTDATAATAQAVAVAQTAQSAVADAVTASNDAEQRLQDAQQAATQVTALSRPSLARQPSAQDPSGALSPLQQANAAIAADVQKAQQAAAAAGSAAQTAQGIAQTDPAAAAAAARAQAAGSSAQSAAQQASAAQDQLTGLMTQAVAAVQAWEQVHAAAPGFIGAQVEDTPATWTVQGCEVTTAAPGSPASDVGLVGRTQRTDPVGDVISSITDATDGGSVWPVTDCAAFNASVQQTRAGDQITVAYYHRDVVWYELSGKWVLESGTANLTAAPGGNCPAALTGSITSALTGNRIDLAITLSGPAGSRPGVNVILDTGGIQSFFPDDVLRSLGYEPFLPWAAGGIVPGATGPANLYHVPGSAITVQDGGRQVPLATGTLTVMGVVNGDFYGLGPDILKQGAKLTTAGDRWTLTPPCA